MENRYQSPMIIGILLVLYFQSMVLGSFMMPTTNSKLKWIMCYKISVRFGSLLRLDDLVNIQGQLSLFEVKNEEKVVWL
jgi:hypothetical protein